MNIYILGAGSFAKMVLNTVHQTRGNSPLCIAGFVVDQEYYRENQYVHRIPVLNVEDMEPTTAEDYIVSGTVWPQRAKMARALKAKGYLRQTVVHPEAWQHISAVVSHGSFVNARAVIDMEAELWEHVVVNRGALIGHNVSVMPYSTVGPGANLCGNVCVGEGVMIGAGAIVREGVSIGHHATVGMGAVVTRDVPAGETWYGVPARKVK